MAENIQNAELKTFYSRGKQYHYVLGTFLSREEVSRIFAANKKTKEKMVETLAKVSAHHYGHMRVPIPVKNINHVTVKMDMDGICSEGGFIASRYEERPEFRNLSYWSADITSEDLEQAHQEANEKVNKVIGPFHANMFASEIGELFGNSPVFRKAVSRYGNFKISFPLSSLLDMYKDQHCGGREPQLRVLGTELYELQIAHYVVVHSPDTDKFNDFPEVPTIQGSSDLLPFVYWKEGTLTWRPESTTIPLKVTISEDGSVCKKCYRSCNFYTQDGKCFHTDDGIYGLWNNLIVAFHLPKGHLKVPKKQLIENLSSCGKDDIYLKYTVLPIKVAEEIVQRMKEDLQSSKCS